MATPRDQQLHLPRQPHPLTQPINLIVNKISTNTNERL